MPANVPEWLKICQQGLAESAGQGLGLISRAVAELITLRHTAHARPTNL